MRIIEECLQEIDSGILKSVFDFRRKETSFRLTKLFKFSSKLKIPFYLKRKINLLLATEEIHSGIIKKKLFSRAERETEFLSTGPDFFPLRLAFFFLAISESRNHGKIVEAIKKAVSKSSFAIFKKNLSLIPGVLNRHTLIATTFSHPDWLIKRMQALDSHGLEQWVLHNDTPPRFLLTKNEKEFMAKARKVFESVGIVKEQEHTVELDVTTWEMDMSWLEKTGIFPTSHESELAAKIIITALGERTCRILDACAAPGSKSHWLSLLSKKGSMIFSCDRNFSRFNRRIFESAGTRVNPVIPFVQDSTQPSLSSSAVFDAVLVDVPCSGTGILRRRPELRNRITEKDIMKAVPLQRALISAMARHVTKGGYLLYSTCSLANEEDNEIRDWFLSSNQEFELESIPDDILEKFRIPSRGEKPVLPASSGLDSFYFCLFRKKK